MSGDDFPAEWTPSTAVVPPSTLEYPSIDFCSKMHAPPKFSFGAKPKTTEDKDPSIPGPGSYFESYADSLTSGRRTAPKFSIGAATRKELEKGRIPGPGAYGTRSFLGEGGKFSITPRRETAASFQKSPGPGAHNVPRTCCFHGPRHSITPRRKSDSAAEGKQRPNPGPGQYELNEDVVSQAKPPKYGFGSAPARPRIPSSWADGVTPGPGAYRHDAALKGRGPKYSVRGKWNPKAGILQ